MAITHIVRETKESRQLAIVIEQIFERLSAKADRLLFRLKVGLRLEAA
jgi:hypothetical protein